jgi:hypothetical protein
MMHCIAPPVISNSLWVIRWNTATPRNCSPGTENLDAPYHAHLARRHETRISTFLHGLIVLTSPARSRIHISRKRGVHGSSAMRQIRVGARTACGGIIAKSLRHPCTFIFSRIGCKHIESVISRHELFKWLCSADLAGRGSHPDSSTEWRPDALQVLPTLLKSRQERPHL